MKALNEQVYHIIEKRLNRICAMEYAEAKGKRKTAPKTVTYSGLVSDYVGYLSELCDCDIERAEAIYSIVTTGEGDHVFCKAIESGF